MKLFHRIFFSVAIGLAVGGCAPDSSTRSLQEVGGDALRAPSVGRAWDKGVKSAENNDLAGLISATQQLRDLGAKDEATRLGSAAAETLVVRAVGFDARANDAVGESKAELQNQSAKLYRQALQLDPQFTSQNEQLLNALGWFLAERGTSKDDFVLGGKLARRALQTLEARSPVNQVFLEHLSSRAAFRDTLAWALFRQGRTDEALREQSVAVADAERATRDKTDEQSQDLQRELREHLQQIKKAAQRR